MEVKWPLRHFCSPNHTAELLRKECELKKKKKPYLALGNCKEFISQMKNFRIKKKKKTPKQNLPWTEAVKRATEVSE